MAQSSPLLRPHRLPLFTRRLNEAAGAAEMNQSPAWAWEGRRTGRPAQSGGDQQDKAGWGGGGVVMPPGGKGAAALLSCHPGSCPQPLSTSGRVINHTVDFRGGGPAGPGWWVHWESGNPGSELEPMAMTDG